MYFRTILSGTLAILLISGAAAMADGRSGQSGTAPAATGSFSLSHIKLPKLFGGAGQMTDANMQMAQAGDPRITAMEEQLRSLSGTVEELNFQILQLQEQLRKMQEDNEFRFQELEQKKTDAGRPSDSNVASVPPVREPTIDEDANGAPMEPEVLVDNGTGDPAVGQSGTGEPPKSFGTITFDEKGNVTGGSVEQTTQSLPNTAGDGEQTAARDEESGETAGWSSDTQVAALPSTDNPDELYRNSYEFILSGDYGTAEAGFRDHIARFPQDQKAADANFWLGEALLGQKKYRDAAEVFLAANKQYPSSKKAPDMLLKLGVALVGLDQHDVACATFSEIKKKYPNASGVLKDRVKQEQALASC